MKNTALVWLLTENSHARRDTGIFCSVPEPRAYNTGASRATTQPVQVKERAPVREIGELEAIELTPEQSPTPARPRLQRVMAALSQLFSRRLIPGQREIDDLICQQRRDADKSTSDVNASLEAQELERKRIQRFKTNGM